MVLCLLFEIPCIVPLVGICSPSDWLEWILDFSWCMGFPVMDSRLLAIICWPFVLHPLGQLNGILGILLGVLPPCCVWGSLRVVF